MLERTQMITREAIAEAEASEDLDDDDIFSGKPSDWEYDASTEEVRHDSEEAEAGREGLQDEGHEGEENPPTPILDAYEKSRDPAEMERLIALAFDSLPERAGPQSNAAVRAELGIQSLRSGRDARKLTWQYRMCGMGEERLPRIVWEAKWANKKRGRQPTEWVKVVEDVWKGFDIGEDETLETEGPQGFKEKISVACAEREEQNLRKECKDKEGLEVYGMLKEGIGFKDYLHGPMDAGTKLKVKFRTGDIGLRERRRRHRTVDEEDDEFKCDCGFECEDRVHVVAECPLYKKEREVYVTELGKIDGTYREMFEAWNREERTVAVLGHRRWVEKAGRDIVRIDRLGKTFLSHLWQSRKERLAIGDRSCGNNAPSSRGRVNIKYKEKAQRTAAHERKLQKRRDRKARDLALFATWRDKGPAEESADAVGRS
ncbi:unnamed protein product [Ectocarpus sp. CCAP 1310/34]|nr:unnamed protein product [Ectocarpus sp. CCAP 1310/34]